ncbi:hypothetical protein F5141DRAFT_1220198 [Pisolithus sp. B1]|nr:hypothetical protein F5141DRAFT_1220198 [Pisolithus sp. B1]
MSLMVRSTFLVGVRTKAYAARCPGYYDGSTALTEYGWAQLFHFSGFYKGEGFAASLVRRQHYLAAQMGLRPGVRVLDVESGVGALALCGIAATIRAPTWEGVYGEIFKVPKPGSVASVVPTSRYSLTCPTTQFGVYEWCMTDAWDPSILSHSKLAHQIEIGSGMPELRPMKLARQAMRNVGFQIDHEEDLADRPDQISWYYSLEGDILKAPTAWDYFTFWRMSWSGKLVTHTAVRFMELFGLFPKGT